MSVSPSYPGIYIQELPSSSHAIVPAPTSIAAFVGYSHPFKTLVTGQPIRIFSFSDYEANFGGLFASGLIDASLPRAVYQFFLNGGSTAYVVGLAPGVDTGGGTIARFGSGGVEFTGATTSGGVTFSALEPTDIVPMKVSVTNVRDANATFDVVVAYGAQVETFRGISLTDVTKAPDKVINKVSRLITAAPTGAAYGATIAK